MPEMKYALIDNKLTVRLTREDDPLFKGLDLLKESNLVADSKFLRDMHGNVERIITLECSVSDIDFTDVVDSGGLGCVETIDNLNSLNKICSMIVGHALQMGDQMHLD